LGERNRGPAEGGTIGSIAAILAVGIVLGVAFNAIGLGSRPGWGLAWVGTDRAKGLDSLDGAIAGLPEIPDSEVPIEADLARVRLFYESGAALFVDARDADEYSAGHIAGALNMPYDVASGEPELIENLDSGGRPIVVYCGGGECELSINLAYEMIFAGHTKVLVYTGGYDEWAAAGQPVATGLAEGN
jgi:rhodanese-related sulfurtransferase